MSLNTELNFFLFSVRLTELNPFSLNMTKELDSFILEYDAKNGTLYFLNKTQKNWTVKFLEYDSKKWNIFFKI